MSRSVSGVWNFLNKVDGEKGAKCRICRKMYSTSGNTSNVWKHLALHGITKENHKDAVIGEKGNVTFKNKQIIDANANDDLDSTHESNDDSSSSIIEAGGSIGGGAASRSASKSSVLRPQTGNNDSPRPLVQQSLHCVIERGKSFQDGGSRSIDITDALLFMVLKDNLCLSTPEKELSKVEIPDRDICAQSLKKFLTGEMVRRFGEAEYNMLLTMATLLDPRFLKVHFQKALAVSKGISLMEKVIVNELRKEAPESNAAHVSSTAIVTRESNSKRNLWNFHDTLVNQVATAYSTDDYVNVARQEIKAFYSRTVMPRKTNPLAVWNNELRHLFPNLFKLAKIYIPAIATSTPSERLFSLAGRIMDDDGCRLSNEHLSQRIFLASCDSAIWDE
ncbi:uncharacterized protein LOC131690025 [Topomyia yanbarensis]|uniref:uncharacterized protein LOC131690025 n=1 Tax=Topomyia yanbarensis TaxID=2498891 RepID=UPI00273ADA10|nr:uncharacterized protein LOC131682814 isoform X2 [Topomyia yanbarensis]XP_058831452.1 uncharacterized protein LOC131690025 [Topomyia yanbarensis]